MRKKAKVLSVEAGGDDLIVDLTRVWNGVAEHARSRVAAWVITEDGARTPITEWGGTPDLYAVIHPDGSVTCYDKAWPTLSAWTEHMRIGGLV